MAKRTNPTNPQGRNTNQLLTLRNPPPCASTMATVESEPTAITTATAANTIGTSYETTCATARIAPSSENLLRDAQPPMNNASTLAVLTANANRMPMFRLTGTNPDATGTTENNNKRRNHRNDGREKMDELVRLPRHDVLFDQHFDSIGNRLENPPATDAVRAVAVLHPAQASCVPRASCRRRSTDRRQE